MATINPVDDVTDEPVTKKQKLEEPSDVCAVVDSVTEEISKKMEKIEQEIVDQIEYYFSDSNLYRDAFLQKEINVNEGWVPVKTLTTFKRLAALSTDIKMIVDALDKSNSDLLEISDDRQSIRRRLDRPLPERNEETRNEIISRSAYVKGFPQDLEMPQLLEFFKNYPKVVHVTIRKYLEKPTKIYKSKGSVFVQFETREQCAEFLTQDIKYNDTELISKWQSDYYASKKTEREEQKKAKHESIELPKGTVLLITGIKPDNTQANIREKLETFGFDVAFVEYRTGENRAFVRMANENCAVDLLAKLDGGKLKFGDDEATVSLVTGEEEEKYLKDCAEKMLMRRNNKNNKSGKNNRKFNNRSKSNQD